MSDFENDDMFSLAVDQDGEFQDILHFDLGDSDLENKGSESQRDAKSPL